MGGIGLEMLVEYYEVKVDLSCFFSPSCFGVCRCKVARFCVALGFAGWQRIMRLSRKINVDVAARR